MSDKQTDGWVKVIRGTKRRINADCTPVHCSAARELAKRIEAAQDKSPYPALTTIELESVIQKFIEARGLMQPNEKS